MTALNLMVPEHEGRGLRSPAGPVDFSSLLESVLPAAFRAALELVGEATEAERLVEEAAVAAWARFGGFRSRTSFRPWFLGILAHLIRTRAQGPDSIDPGNAIDRPLAALPVEERVATTLHLVGELSYEELGSALDLPPAAARARVHRGRALLRQATKKAATGGGLPGRWH
jgi:DNA-directed RNA polymerase specialized sigma24 family protein